MYKLLLKKKLKETLKLHIKNVCKLLRSVKIQIMNLLKELRIALNLVGLPVWSWWILGAWGGY